jgi:hypothetical protein
MWRCPDCRRQFANRNQSHACGPKYTLASHFAGKPKAVRAIFDKLLAVAKKSGPVTVLPEKTRIAFQVRMSFAAFVIRQELRGWPRSSGAAPGESALSPHRNSWLAEAYHVGEQRHLL